MPPPTPTDKPTSAPDEGGNSSLEETAREKLGLRYWERPTLYRETAEAATDTDLPFWIVLFLSGAIATLGLTLNSTAVVIGAMLVAPLLGPLLGLSLALAVGDGRLFVQTATTVLLGAAGIVALSAVLTAALPFQTVTDQIASRTRPTTLDLWIAVCSGLAGAVVTASRETRLSASIPGVAVAVALVPPLGVAGFGIGAGLQWPIIRGSMLLFGANLAGIVLSGLLVFLLVGMYRADMVEVARAWHRADRAKGLSARLDHLRALDRLATLSTPWTRALLVLAFMALVSVPLSSSLAQVVREVRITGAVDAAVRALGAGDHAFILNRDVTFSERATTVRLRLATTEWVTAAQESTFVRDASREAREPVALDLEQVPASTGDLASIAAALPSPPPTRTEPAAPAPFPATLATVRGRLADALGGLVLPDSVAIIGGAVTVGADEAGALLEVAYAAPRRLPPEAEALLTRQAAQALGLDATPARATAVLLGERPLPDSAEAAGWAMLLRRYDRLRLSLAGDSAEVARVDRQLRASGAPAGRISAGAGPTQALFSLAPEPAP